MPALRGRLATFERGDAALDCVDASHEIELSRHRQGRDLHELVEPPFDRADAPALGVELGLDRSEPPFDGGADAGVDDEPDASSDAGAPAPIGTVQCTSPVPAPISGICDATQGSGDSVLVQGNVLVETGVYLDGAVLYRGDRIVCVGCDCQAAPEAENATVVACGGSVVSPGLINAHGHLNYDERAPLAVGSVRGRLTLGPDRFFDGRIFDPDAVADYLASFSCNQD